MSAVTYVKINRECGSINQSSMCDWQSIIQCPKYWDKIESTIKEQTGGLTDAIPR